MEGIIITQLRRHPEGGYWTARINLDGEHMDVQCQFGSWMTLPDKDGTMQEVLSPAKEILVAKMRTEEGREKRALEALAATNPFVKKASKNGKPTNKEKIAA